MKHTLAAFLTLLGIAAIPATTFAQVPLGTAQDFGVLAGSAVTNTGATTVTGDVGVHPGTAVTGFPPGIVVSGTIHSADAAAGQAQTDLTAAYNVAAALPCGTDLTGQDLGGLTLTPGVYCFTSSAQLTGALTLDFQGDPAALFVIKTGSTLTTASASSVVMINNGGATCPPNVFWQIGSSATLGTTTAFVGNILANVSITMNTGATLNGRALARTGAVTLASNTITACVGVCPVITVNPATLPNGLAGTPYDQTITATGGTAPYVFTVTSGMLPAGLTLNPATGSLSGTPAVNGTSSFTITATDTALCGGSRAYTLVIGAVGQPGVPTLDFVGLSILALLLGGAAVFVMSRSSM